MDKDHQSGKTIKETDIIKFFTRELEITNFNNGSLVVSLIYGVLGSLWILFSDQFLEFVTQNPVLYRQLQTYKGWLYVVVTMLLIYALMRKRMKMVEKIDAKNKETYEELKAAHNTLVQVEKELIHERNLTQYILDNAPVIIATWDSNGKMLSMNPYALNLYGYKKEEVINKSWMDIFILQEEKEMTDRAVNKIHQTGRLLGHEGKIVTKDGTFKNILWYSSRLDGSSDQDIIVTIGIDVTERKKYEEIFRHLAFYDRLTGLPNRIMFEEEVSKLIEGKPDSKFSIIYIDIDNFKYINDTLGHQIGDEFLKFFGSNLEYFIKKPNLVARLGGDEFGILMKDIDTEEGLLESIEDIKNSFSKTWSIGNHLFFVSMSIGIALYPDHGENISTLFKNADIAMYATKRHGKDSVQLYKEEIQAKSIWNIQMANKLQKGIENEEFTLYFQPQYKLNTFDIFGMEVLVRWNHSKEGFISPEEFIPVAEETGQIYGMEQWIFEKALKQKKQWEAEGYHHLELSINLSTKTLLSDIKFKEIERLLSIYDVDYSKIIIEITETAIISNVFLAMERLKELKDRGIRIALDDFGTGYSSLTYLKKLPIDIVKLDRSFVGLIPHNEIDTAIVKNILFMARDLGYQVVAEGIEKEEQLEYLKNNRCGCGQGFLLCKPLPQVEINKVLRNHFTGKDKLEITKTTQ